MGTLIEETEDIIAKQYNIDKLYIAKNIMHECNFGVWGMPLEKLSR